MKMQSRMNMQTKLNDRKNWLVYAFWSTVNTLVIKHRFRSVKINGWHNLPKAGQPFILISNHTSRWDGLLIYKLVGRPANFLVSPNELVGFQGTVLRSMGAFPASTRFDLKGHVASQVSKGEPVIIFPEGDIYRDGHTHQFKSGTARFALGCVDAAIDIPIVPVAVKYSDDGRAAEISIAPGVRAADYLLERTEGSAVGVRVLTERLYREVCHLRYELGSDKDHDVLFGVKVKQPFTAASA